MDRINELLAKLADLTASEIEELNGLVAAEFETVSAAIEDGAPTPAQVETLETLADASDSVVAEVETRNERAAKAANATKRMDDAKAAREDKAAAEKAAADEAKAQAKADKEAAKAEKEAADVVAEAEEATEEAAKTKVEAADVEVVDEGADEKELVTASAAGDAKKVPSLTQVLNTSGTPLQVDAKRAIARFGAPSLTAAAEVPGFATGEELDGMDGIVQAVINRHQKFKGQSGSVNRALVPHGMSEDSQRFPTLAIKTHFPPELTVNDSGSVEEAMRVIAYATDEANLPGGSLVASGGWCTPSETLYDLCVRETSSGLFSLPTINASRGGLRFVENGGPSFRDIFTAPNGAFFGTEASDAGSPAIPADPGDPGAVPPVPPTPAVPAVPPSYFGPDGTTSIPEKLCAEIPCPVWDECRLGFHGMCVRAGLLMTRSYPELISRFIQGLIVAHRHRMSLRWLAEIAAASTSVVFPTQQSTTTSILSALELQVWDYRHAHRLDPSATIEVVLPYWLTGNIRSDLSKRLGVDMLSVSDAQINTWFRERGVNPQWVYWQDAFDGLQPTMGAVNPPTTWPASVQILMYPAGTWVMATSDIFSIDTLYDSALLATNDYTALFTEEAYCIIQQCSDSRVLTIPLCPSGATAAGVTYPCTSR